MYSIVSVSFLRSCTIVGMHCDGSSSGKHVYLRVILVVRLGFPIVLTTLFCTFGR
jgi:hypothetical protein